MARYACFGAPCIWAYGGLGVPLGNHNSHLDTLALMSLFPWPVQRRVRPVAAADYFLSNPSSPRSTSRSWVSFPSIAVGRRPATRFDIILSIPEGTRGEPERLETFRLGLYSLARVFVKGPPVGG